MAWILSAICIVRNCSVMMRLTTPSTAFVSSRDSSADEWSCRTRSSKATRAISHVLTGGRPFHGKLPAFMVQQTPVGSSGRIRPVVRFSVGQEHGVTVLLDGQGADIGVTSSTSRVTSRRAGMAIILDWQSRQHDSGRYPLALPRLRLEGLRDRLPFRVQHWLSNRFRIGTNLLYGLRPEVAARSLTEAGAAGAAGPAGQRMEQDSFSF